MNVAQETLDLRRGRLSLPLSLLMSAFSLLIPPANLSVHLHRLTERSPTTTVFTKPHCQEHPLTQFKGSLCAHAPSDALNNAGWVNTVARSFGLYLSPVTSSTQDDSISELLRFLYRMAASE